MARADIKSVPSTILDLLLDDRLNSRGTADIGING